MTSSKSAFQDQKYEGSGKYFTNIAHRTIYTNSKM